MDRDIEYKEKKKKKKKTKNFSRYDIPTGLHPSKWLTDPKYRAEPHKGVGSTTNLLDGKYQD